MVDAPALWDAIRVEREGKGQSTLVTVVRREIRKWPSESAGRGVGGTSAERLARTIRRELIFRDMWNIEQLRKVNALVP